MNHSARIRVQMAALELIQGPTEPVIPYPVFIQVGLGLHERCRYQVENVENIRIKAFFSLSMMTAR